jgi:hypothetical protein
VETDHYGGLVWPFSFQFPHCSRQRSCRCGFFRPDGDIIRACLQAAGLIVGIGTIAIAVRLIARSLADFGKREAHGVIRDRLLDAWSAAERDGTGLTAAGRAALEAVLETEKSRLRTAAGRNSASIFISVDQAEEMARADGDSGDAMVD